MQFKTVDKSSETEVIIERSRFITLISPCATEDEARAVLAERKKRHYSATHNCYAYITDNGRCLKFSDDGEPGGTAGQPIMSALKNSEIINAIVIVTRYFGGIKLGAGGLTRAYLNCAADALKTASVKEYQSAIKIAFSLSYEDYQTFLRIKKDDFAVKLTDFSDKVNVELLVKSGAITRFSDVFKQTFFGKYDYKTIGEEFYCF